MSRCLLLRADANIHIGTGHVMRCLALAQAWQDAGGKAHFASCDPAPALVERLQAEGVAVHVLPAIAGSADDAARTVALAKELSAAWVVVDGYHFDAAYQHAVRQAGLRLLFIDDYGHADYYYADIVLNQNIYAAGSLYAGRAPGVELLLGTRYALLRREFWAWQNWRREIPTVARKALVTMGGADPDNVTLKVIRAMQYIDIDDLEIVVVVGGNNPHYPELQSAIGDTRYAIRLERNVTDMPALMAWADMAVSAGGSTCWELASMGLPTLILALADNQEAVAAGLDAAGAALDLGRAHGVTPAEIARALADLAAAPERRAAMARQGQQLVDGNGARRVVRRMRQLGLALRPAQPADCRLVWEWANDPTVRAASFSSAPIPWETHVAWFTARLADQNTLFYIILDDAGAPVGQVRLDIEGRAAVISISLAPGQQGQGYGSRAIHLACRRVLDSAAVDTVHAYIKPDNVASARAFARAGFVENGPVEVRGQPARHFVLQKETMG